MRSCKTPISVRLVTIAVLSILRSGLADPSLVAHYTFDDISESTARDRSGHGHNGIIHGAHSVKLTTGSALEFDGVDDYVEIPDTPTLRLGQALTVELWVNPRFATTGGLISKNGCSTYRQNYSILLQENGVLFQLVECPEIERGITGKRIQKDRWSHVVGTYDGSKLKIYTNGKPSQRPTPIEFKVGTHNGPLYLGAAFYARKLVSYFGGRIGEVRVYNRALSAKDVRQRYDSSKAHHVSKLSALIARMSTSVTVDTTPPTLYRQFPAPDSTTHAATTIEALFQDQGSGVDVSTVRVSLDGKDVTATTRITATGVQFRSASPLSKGVHRVVVSAKDRTGNQGNQLRWRFGVEAPVAVEAKFENGVFIVSEEPHFPLGYYGGSTSPLRAHLGYLRQASDAGINYQLVGEVGREELDAYLAYGVKLLKAVTFSAAALDQGDATRMTSLLKTKNHPGMLGWWTEYGEGQASIIEAASRFLRENDQNHPTAFMHTWAGPRSDIYYVYAYPILNPLFDESNIISLYEGCIRPAMEAAAKEGKGKHVWFISQAFDYRLDSNRGKDVTLDGGFRPTRQELRAMNYLALAKGVKGLLFYSPAGNIAGTEYVDDIAIRPRQWTEVLKISREMRYLSPVLTLGTVVNTVQLKNAPPAIHFLELKHAGEHTLLAINVERELVLATWEFERPTEVRVLFENRQVEGAQMEVTDLFAPLDVHVYRWRE